MRLINLFMILVAFHLSGCATWTYDNQNYPSSTAALQAMKYDVDVLVSQIPVVDEPTNYTVRVVLPSDRKYEEDGLQRLGTPSAEMIQYLVRYLDISTFGVVRAIDKSQLFSSLTYERTYYTNNPPMADEDFLIWLHLSDAGSGEWYIKSRSSKSKTLIPIDSTADSFFKVKSWLEQIELFVMGSSAGSPRSRGSVVTAEKKQPGTGTGFVISESGDVLTAAHVVDDCQTITGFKQQQKYDVSLIASDPINDLALLRVNGGKFRVVSFAPENIPALGQEVIVAGYPLSGLLSELVQVSSGIVGATSGFGNDFSNFQLTAPVQPGNSGGPVLDERGQVIGVVLSKLNASVMQQMTGDIPQNVNFALNNSMAKAFLSANGVDFTEGTSRVKLSGQEISSSVGEFTMRIECAY